jgi:hypothetical protein
MTITEEIEQKFGAKVEDFNSLEKETYFKMLEDVQKSQMSNEKLRDYIIAMRNAVERELINEPEFIRVFIFKFENRKQILLKARLQNYMLLESFLISPERAKQALEDMISGMVGR